MALREENHFFTRRIAEQGSDEIVFYSQDRKIQETDPKDVIWDEIIGKEEHPEDGDGYKFQETDSKAFIWDGNFWKEEYLGNCNTIYQSPSVFDEYENEEWYLRLNDDVSEVWIMNYNPFVSCFKGLKAAKISGLVKSLVNLFNGEGGLDFQKSNKDNVQLAYDQLSCYGDFFHKFVILLKVLIIWVNIILYLSCELTFKFGMELRGICNIIIEVVACPQRVVKTQFLSSKRKKMPREIKLFKRVIMIIMNGDHIVVPFDPGGFDEGGKTRG